VVNSALLDFQSSTLLCICTQPNCNGGDFQDILARSLLGEIDDRGVGQKAKFEIEQQAEEAAAHLSGKEIPIRR
jgi:hypothetical protein